MARLMEVCFNCGGHGVVADYGLDGSDFHGPKDCPICHGTGTLPMRDARGRYMSDKKLVPTFETEVLNR